MSVEASFITHQAREVERTGKDAYRQDALLRDRQLRLQFAGILLDQKHSW